MFDKLRDLLIVFVLAIALVYGISKSFDLVLSEQPPVRSHR